MAATANAPELRTCATTGFRVDESGRRLALAYAVAAVLMLAAGGVMAIFIALQRQGLPISDDWWYRLVASHGATMLLFWLLLFEVAALYWGSTMLLNARMRAPRVAWGVFGAMLLGIALAQWAMFSGNATVMFTAYPPLTAHPLYYLGILLFAGGVLVAICLFFANVVMARRERTYEGSLPLVVYGFAAAAIIGVYSLLTGAAAYLLLFLQSVGVLTEVDPALYRILFWGIGHGAQQVNLAAMVAVWYALIGLTLGGRPVNEGLSRFAFVLLIAFIHLGAVHHLMVDPGLGTSHRIMNTSYLLYLAVLASLIHAFSVPAGIEAAQRERGIGKGLFGWLVRAPWREPGFSSLVLSVVYFGFVAGVSGVLMGTMQLNMLIHNTLFVVGHFHATVVSGTTLAFMGISYYLLPLLARRELVGTRIARWQPYVFAGGVALLTLAMLAAGQMGVPRRVADLGYADAPVGVTQFGEGAVPLMMTLVSVGAILAVVGGVMYVWVMVRTLLVGERTDAPLANLALRFGPTAAPPPAPASELPHNGLKGRWARFEAPGTYAMVLFFLAWFVVLYVVAHFNLAQSWPVG